MAEVSYLQLRQDDEDDVVVSLDSAPCWSHDFDGVPFSLEFLPLNLPLSHRSPISTVHQRNPNRSRTQVLNNTISDPNSITTVDLFHRENQVNFVMDLFHQRVEQSSSRVLGLDVNSDPGFGVIEQNNDMGSTHLEVDLGLGFSMDVQNDDNISGFMVADCDGLVSESGESSTVSGGAEFLMGGTRVVDIGSDSEESENGVLGIDLNPEDDDFGLDSPLCWDSFQLEDQRDRDANEDFEWEEVEGEGGVDERGFLGMFFDGEADDDASVSPVIPSREEVGEERLPTLGNLEWEVLLNVHNFDENVEVGHDGEEPYLGEAEYEMFFGHFVENENALMGRPPASKIVVENLQSVILTQEVVENGNALCAVCKDEINAGERVKQLPCAHRYHGDCIVPWLGIRNTCPVCRYELPTDDPDYERAKTQRDGRAQ